MSRGISKALIVGVAVVIAVVIIATYYATQALVPKHAVKYPITVVDYLAVMSRLPPTNHHRHHKPRLHANNLRPRLRQ
ncbi:hypothetical protein [Vulcanisaeta sp. JCM 14467]|uniref:hypothetical protein n=1 Tax=Vulcanisaeta sp. JCM 14467 TaxID=1295370 RepID=UPI000A5ED234|nr:hypothetical protein [Vulcanisaeta sp. JCM 14467]